MKIKKALISIITCAGLIASTALPVFAASASPDYIEGKNLSWNIVDGKYYWYEDGKKQGISSDTKCFSYKGTIRGREIYDKESDGWYWLDTVYDGARAVGKEVFMPYVFKNEAGWSDADIRKMADTCDDGMKDFVYNAIKNKTGKWVRYDENGKMLKGWVTIQGALAEAYPKQKGNTYYYDTMTGIMAKGWITFADGMSYHFNEITGKLEGTKIANGGDEETATIYYDAIGTKGNVYAIEADVEMQGSGSGYQALLVIGNGYDSIKFGITYEKDSAKNANANGKCAITTDLIAPASNINERIYHDVYYTSDNASCKLLMIVDNTGGAAWLFHNGKYVGNVTNEALKGDALYIRAEGVQLGGGNLSAAFKNVKVKSPSGKEEIVTRKGNPYLSKADVANISYTPFVANSDNGYLYCGVSATNSTYTAPSNAYGYIEFVNGTNIR